MNCTYDQVTGEQLSVFTADTETTYACNHLGQLTEVTSTTRFSDATNDAPSDYLYDLLGRLGSCKWDWIEYH